MTKDVHFIEECTSGMFVSIFFAFGPACPLLQKVIVVQFYFDKLNKRVAQRT